METEKLATLKPLGQIYPRLKPSEEHINALTDALRAGAVFPPLIVERSSLRIVDGFHRWSAYKRARGDDFDVPVQLKDYASDEELLADAVAANERHGLRFTEADCGRVVVLAARLKLKAPDLVPILHLSPMAMQRVRCTYLEAAAPRKADPTGGAMPRSVRPKESRVASEGRTTKTQPRNPKLWQARDAVDNLTLLLESGTVDGGYQDLLPVLAQLRAAIQEFLAKVVAA